MNCPICTRSLRRTPDGKLLHRNLMNAIDCAIMSGKEPNRPGYTAPCDHCGGDRERRWSTEDDRYHWVHVHPEDAALCKKYGRGRGRR